MDAEQERAVGRNGAVGACSVGQLLGDIDVPVIVLDHILYGRAESLHERRDGRQLRHGRLRVEVPVLGLREDGLHHAVHEHAFFVVEAIGGRHHPAAETDAHAVGHQGAVAARPALVYAHADAIRCPVCVVVGRLVERLEPSPLAVFLPFVSPLGLGLGNGRHGRVGHELEPFGIARLPIMVRVIFRLVLAACCKGKHRQQKERKEEKRVLLHCL